MLEKGVLLAILFNIVVKVVAINVSNTSDRIEFFMTRKSLNEILQLCCQDHLNPLIITEQSSKYIHHPKGELLSIILVNDSFNIEHKIRNSNPHRGTFLLTALSDDQLNITLSRLQSTPWWNTLSYFFLIGPSSHSCPDASKMLTIMWKRKILSVIYLCYDVDAQAVMLYTFNPFTNYAPHPWKWAKSFQDKPDPRWTLYEYQYQLGDQTICPAIMFDKTLRLDDYVLSAVIENNLHPKDVPTNVPIRLNNYQQYAPLMGIAALTEVFIQMKVKVNITDTETFYITKDGEFHGNIQDIINHDIYLKTIPMNSRLNSSSYPDILLSMVLIGQKRPFLNTEDKIFSFLHISILVPLIIIFLISVIVLKLNKQQECVSAFLKMWQLYLGNSIPQVLNNTPTRIFFFGVFLLVIVINGAFQSKLASFLTKPERIYINSLEDAFRLKYHIYGLKEYLIDQGYAELPPEKLKYIHFMATHKCAAQVLNDSQSVCLTSPHYSTRHAIKYDLYVSPPVHFMYTVYWLSPDFPLKGKINTIILRLQASGVIVRIYKKIFNDRMDYLHAHELDEAKFQSRPIELHDLKFIFKFLILGLICSLIVFIVEFWHS